MKWSNHIALTGALTYAITGDAFGAMISGTAAVIPDMMEGKNFNRRIHRTVSHWFIPYMSLLIASVFFIAFIESPDKGTILSLFFSPTPNPLLILAVFCQYLSFGALLHICEDALCGKVPLFNPCKKDVGVRLFITGSGREYCLTVVVMFLVIVFKYFKIGSFS